MLTFFEKVFWENQGEQNLIKCNCLHYPYYRGNSFQENDVEFIEVDESEDKQEGNSPSLSIEGTGINR